MKSATCMVAGSSVGFWKDFERVFGWVDSQDVHHPGCASDADVLAVNLTGLYVPHARYLVSLHPEMLGPLRDLRRSLDWNGDGASTPVTISFRSHPGVDRVIPKPPQGIGGTSALFAVRVALTFGYDRVILAGVPLDDSGRFFDPPGAPHVWPHAQDRGPWELAAKAEFGDRVTSCSGWTAELLGEPE